MFKEDYGRNCPYCAEDFIARRMNQLYCSFRCKYTFNNRKRDYKHEQTKQVNRLLSRNFTLLKQLWAKKSEQVIFTKQQLIELGYSFRHLTQLMKLDDGREVMGVYCYGLAVNEGQYEIINTEECDED